jgi:hypothetical protein
MKAFKDKAYLPPVDKLRKDQGSYQEKIERKIHTGHKKIAPKASTGSQPLISNPTNNKKKKLSIGAYVILGLIIILSSLFLFLIFSLFFNKNNII